MVKYSSISLQRDSINQSSSFDKLLNRLEKTIQRVEAGTKQQQVEAGSDAPTKNGDYRRQLAALAHRVKATSPRAAPSKRTAPPISLKQVSRQATDFEVELILSTSHQNDSAKHVNALIWKAYATTKSFSAIIRGVIVAQAAVRTWLAVRQYEKDKKEKLEAVKVIRGEWRRYRCRSAYRRHVKDVIACQSHVRQYLAIKTVQQMRHDKMEAASNAVRIREASMATIIQAKCRTILPARQYTDTKHKLVLLQCIIRKLIALKKLELLKEEKLQMQADMVTKISSNWKRYTCQMSFKQTVQSFIACQSTIRRFLAIKALAMLKEDRRMLEDKLATRIASVWRTYRVRSGYMVVLKAARRHKQRYNAAAIIQANWRAFAGRRRYDELKTSVLSIECLVRMKLAIHRRKKMVLKLKEAATYHSDDFFAYSKKRKDAANKIQALYRMRYSARMTGNAKGWTLMKKDHDNDTKQSGKMRHTNDSFAESKKRRDGAIKIQSAFREHLVRVRYEETQYLAENFFKISAKRRVAAAKIQTCYRKHLFRTTCHFRPLPIEEVTCIDIVKSSDDAGHQIVVGATELLNMFMSMIPG